VEEFCFDIGLVANLEFGWRNAAVVSAFFVLSSHVADVNLEVLVKFSQVDWRTPMCAGRSHVAFWMNCNIWVVTLVSKEWRGTGRLVRSIVIRELRKRKVLTSYPVGNCNSNISIVPRFGLPVPSDNPLSRYLEVK
jgi:hypothetical protein